MNTNLIIEAIKNRQSIREFIDQEIPQEIISEILDCGRWAPSGLNNQPWRFLVLKRGNTQKNNLADCTKYSKVILDSEVLICVFLDKDVSYHYVKDCQAIGACIQNMLLAIHAYGLGGVWLGEIYNQKEQTHQILEVDSGRFEFMAAIAAGYASQGEFTHKGRKGLDELLL